MSLFTLLKYFVLVIFANSFFAFYQIGRVGEAMNPKFVFVCRSPSSNMKYATCFGLLSSASRIEEVASRFDLLSSFFHRNSPSSTSYSTTSKVSSSHPTASPSSSPSSKSSALMVVVNVEVLWVYWVVGKICCNRLTVWLVYCPIILIVIGRGLVVDVGSLR